MRFNDQVKVKTIKGRGKGRSLSSVNLRTGEDVDEDDDADENGMGEEFSFEDESGSENGSDLGSDLESNSGESDEGREAVERLKDDLFADDDEGSKTGLQKYYLSYWITTDVKYRLIYARG